MLSTLPGGFLAGLGGLSPTYSGSSVGTSGSNDTFSSMKDRHKEDLIVA